MIPSPADIPFRKFYIGFAPLLNCFRPAATAIGRPRGRSAEPAKPHNGYASQLHISSVYLNEIVNKSVGMSATQYILNEWILEAKRQLIYSHDTIQEIGNRLGVSDSAYFTKIFTKTTGTSPSSFRKRILE